MSLTAEDMLRYAEAVVLVQGSHPLPALMLEHRDGSVTIIMLPADVPPHETLAETREQLAEVVREQGVRVVGLAAALDTYVRVAPAGWDGDLRSMLPAKDDPAAQDALMVWYQHVGSEPVVLQERYEAVLRLDGSWDVTWHEPKRISEGLGVAGRLDAALRQALRHVAKVRPL